MPFNGTGTYVPPSLPGTWSPASSGAVIDPTDWNTLLTDFTTAHSTAICKDGQTTVTADLPMAVHKFTGLSAGSAAGHSVRFEQVFPAGTSLLATLLRSYLAGLTLSRASATTIGVAAGVAMDDTNIQMMVLSSGTINCAATGADGLDTGSLANTTWYHVYAIAKTDGTVARLASTSVSSPTMPSGYTLKRRIGSVKTDGSAQILAFVQDGDLFQWSAPVVGDFASGTNPGTSAGTRTIPSVPTGVNVLANIQLEVVNLGGAGNVAIYISDLATNDVAPSASGSVLSDAPIAAVAAGAVGLSATRLNVRTNTSAQVRSRVSFSDANVAFNFNTLGWTDRRGRDA